MCGDFAAVLKATFSYAMAVMDKVEGWNEDVAWCGQNLFLMRTNRF